MEPFCLKGLMKAKKNHLHTFTVDVVSEMDDYHYRGTFTTKKLSVADMSAIGVRKSQLNGGMYFDEDAPGKGVDKETDEFNAMIAHLEISLMTTPKWWDLSEIADVEVISEVYKEVLEFENNYFRRNALRAMGSNESGSQAKDEKSNAGGAAGEMVDEEIQFALEP